MEERALTERWAEVAKDAGKPLPEALIDLLNQTGSMEKAAHRIGFSRASVQEKVNELGIAKAWHYHLRETTAL